MKKIVIYEPGRAKCTALEEVTDTAQLAAAGVMETPALAVDGRIPVSGTSPSQDKIGWELQMDSPEKNCCGEKPADSKAVKGNAPHPESGSCGCGDGGCCGAFSKGKGGWKKAAMWAAMLLILLAVVKMVNHRERSGGGEPPRTAVPGER